MRSTNRPIAVLTVFVTAASLLVACAGPAQPGAANPTGPTQPPSSSETGPTTPPTSASPASGANLENTRWNLVSFGKPGAETQVIAGSKVTIEFNANGQVSGNGGCNKFSGSYTTQNGAIKFDQIISTLMACADNNVTQQEQSYFQALNSAIKVEVQGDQLSIFYGAGEDVLNFKSVAPKATPTSE